MHILLKFDTNEEAEQAISSVEYRAEDCESQPLFALAEKMRRRLLNTCCYSGSGQHVMVQPDDTDAVKWGEYGLCDFCHHIGKMPT